MRRLLVGLDGSKLAEASLPYAEVFARASGATVTLVRVVADDDDPRVQDANPSLLPFLVAYPTGDPAEESAARRAERHAPAAYLDGIAERLGRRGITTESAVVKGKPGELLVAEAEARQAGLIVVTTHGRSGLGRWVFGSVTETILARSSVPVLVARAWSPPSPLVPPEGKTTIVVPLDGSPLAESALSQAEESARVLGGEICLVRVISLPYISPDLDEEMGPIYDLAVREELERDARAYLTSIARRLSATGLGVTSAVEFGNPAGTILTTARERKAGLIVMATHGRTGLAQTLLGSVALEMLHRGDLPVMFVRGAAQPKAF